MMKLLSWRAIAAPMLLFFTWLMIGSSPVAATPPAGCPGGPAGPPNPETICPLTGEWKDKDTIVVNDGGIETIFVHAADIEDEVVFVQKSDLNNDRCLDGPKKTIEDFVNDGESATLITYKSDPTGLLGCTDPASSFDLELSHKNRAAELFQAKEPTQDVHCQAGFSVAWVFCGIVEVADSIVDFSKDFIVGYLKTTPLTNTGDQSNRDLFNAWKNMRTLANVFLVPVFFIVIFSQALSLNIDAYTVKKLLPRLVAAAILIQFSYYIVAILVDITNVLGNGIGSLLTSTFTRGAETLEIDPGGVANFLSVFTVLGGIFALFNIGAVLALLGALSIPLIASVVGVLLTLVFRQLMIVVLAIAAPIAFALWILPNTERVFKLWWSTLLKILMMYPMITMLFAAGTITAGLLTSGVTDPNAKFAGVTKDILALVAIIIPLAAVPFTFKFAGGALAAVAGQMDRLGKLVTRDASGKRRQWYQDDLDRKKKDLALSMEGKGILGDPFTNIGNRLNQPGTPGWVQKLPGAKTLSELPGRRAARYLEGVNARANDREMQGKYKPETEGIIGGYGTEYHTAAGRKRYDELQSYLRERGQWDEDQQAWIRDSDGSVWKPDHDAIAAEMDAARPELKDKQFVAAMTKRAIESGQKDMVMPASHVQYFKDKFGDEQIVEEKSTKGRLTQAEKDSGGKVTGVKNAAALIMHQQNSAYQGDVLAPVLASQTGFSGKEKHGELFMARRNKDGSLHVPTPKEIASTLSNVYNYKEGALGGQYAPNELVYVIFSDIKDNLSKPDEETIGKTKVAQLQELRNSRDASIEMKNMAEEVLKALGPDVPVTSAPGGRPDAMVP